jgi:hypothetical protein
MRKQDIFPTTYYNSKDLLSKGPIMLTIDYVAMEPVGEGTNKQEKLVDTSRSQMPSSLS